MQNSFQAIIDVQTSTMILGSAPSIISIRKQEYYAGPGNQFWPLMCQFLSMDSTLPYEEKCAHLLRNGVGLWDVYRSFERDGSLDSQFIKKQLNNFSKSIPLNSVNLIITNGKKASSEIVNHPQFKDKFILNCPSTSSANNAQMIFRQQQWLLAFEIHQLIVELKKKQVNFWFGCSNSLREKVFQLRREVFVDEQNIPLNLEFDSFDFSDEQNYFLISDKKYQPIATIRFQAKDLNTIQPDRFCVKESFRRQDIGHLLLTIYEKYAKFIGYSNSELSAELPAVPFYLKEGYEIIDGPYIEDGISCLKMQKSLIR